MNITNLFTRRAALAVTAGVVFALGALLPLTAATTVGGKNLQQVRAVRETVANATSSTVFVPVPGAITNITLPPNQRNLLIVRFSAESACSGGTGWCSLRILANGVEMAPAAGGDFAFDSSDGNSETASSWESHAMERSQEFPASTAAVVVTVTVERAVTNAALTFRLDDWHLTVEQFHQ